MYVKAIYSNNVDTTTSFNEENGESMCKIISLSFHNPFGDNIQFVVLK